MSHVDESCRGAKQVEVSDYPQVPLGSSITDLGGTDSDSDGPYPRVTIGKLPDDVLLEIFVYVVGRQVDYFPLTGPRRYEHEWRALVHVCKRWRSVVFSSPSPGSPTFLHKQKTSEQVARHLATIPHLHPCIPLCQEIATGGSH
jgi:hypothetical protein